MKHKQIISIVQVLFLGLCYKCYSLIPKLAEPSCTEESASGEQGNTLFLKSTMY